MASRRTANTSLGEQLIRGRDRIEAKKINLSTISMVL